MVRPRTPSLILTFSGVEVVWYKACKQILAATTVLSGCLGVVSHIFFDSNRKLVAIHHTLALCGYEGETPREYKSAGFASVFTQRHCSTEEYSRISLVLLI